MYRSSVPVTAGAFFDREAEIEQLTSAVEHLVAGAPRWVCLLGPRKVGKTSLLLELSRRTHDPKVVFVVIDVFEAMQPSLEVFRRYALRAVDAAFGGELGLSLEALGERPASYRAAIVQHSRFGALPPALKAEVIELCERPMTPGQLRVCLDLPERLAEALDLFVLAAIDEFQELAAPMPGAKQKDLMPLLRSVWQRHKRVAYVISGSAQTLLADMVTTKSSPFFQHFSLMKVGPFPRDEAVKLLRDNAPEGRALPLPLCERAVEVLGGHPFYLQLLGHALTSAPPPYDERAFKDALQELLFSRSGQLALYFENELDRLVGRSTYLYAVLSALAERPLRMSEISAAIHAPSGATAIYVDRLADAVVRNADGRYALADHVFALWLRWRRPGGSVVPMKILGDLAEQVVAESLAEMGFELVYQSRASRGAFDLLAIRGPHRLGVQVKRARLPVHFTTAEWSRLEAEGERIVTHWAVALVLPEPESQVLFLDPRKARRADRGVSLSKGSALDNLLVFLDRRPVAKKRSSPR
ncbi:MAG: ATP-binding protein [Byssovorax sp.]